LVEIISTEERLISTALQPQLISTASTALPTAFLCKDFEGGTTFRRDNQSSVMSKGFLALQLNPKWHVSYACANCQTILP
jgi:hypothetical protein